MFEMCFYLFNKYWVWFIAKHWRTLACLKYFDGQLLTEKLDYTIIFVVCVIPGVFLEFGKRNTYCKKLSVYCLSFNVIMSIILYNYTHE